MTFIDNQFLERKGESKAKNVKAVLISRSMKKNQSLYTKCKIFLHPIKLSYPTDAKKVPKTHFKPIQMHRLHEKSFPLQVQNFQHRQGEKKELRN